MYLGLDLGTSGVTALLLNADLEVVARHACPIETHHPQLGWAEQDPYEILAAVERAGAAVLAGVPDGVPVTVGFANPGESVLAWDASSGQPLTPLVVWSDTRAEATCQRLRASSLEARVTELSGLHLDAYFCAAKFAWLLEHDAAVLAARKSGSLRLCTLDAWLIYQLSGAYLTEHSTASRTQLYDQVAGRWCTELLALFDIPADALPDIRPSLSPLGTLAIGERRLPLTAALLDQVAALAGNGCLTPGSVKVTYGTGAFVLAQAGAQYPAPDTTLLRTVGFSDARERGFILDGGVYTAGSAVQWLQRTGLLPDIAEASALAERAVGGRVRFLPAFSGLGAPWYDAGATGVLSGLSAQSGQAEIVRGVLDGIASRVADIVERLGVALPHMTRLRADGGLVQNAYLMQRQADLTGLVIERSTEHEATALGVALLAGVSAGTLDWAQVKARTAKTTLFMPNLPEAERLQERAAWKSWLVQAAALPHSALDA